MTVKLLYSLLLIKNVDNDDDDDMQIYSAHKIKHAWIRGVGSHQVARWGVLIIDIELGYEMRF